ncbi:unnamed protein product [Lathyrus sativus]|nr:unnamed protein product [Lathyrus sativus]
MEEPPSKRNQVWK